MKIQIQTNRSDSTYTFMEKGGGAPPWGRKCGRSEEKEPKAGEAEDADDEESNRGPRSLLPPPPRPPPGLKLITV